MAVVNDFLLWLEEHQIGILTTIALHLLIISVILVLKIRTHAEQEYSIMVDLSEIQAAIDRENPETLPQEQINAHDFVQTMQQEYHIRSIPVNTAEARAVENIEKMIRDIKREEHIADRPPQDTPDPATNREEKLLKDEARIYDDKYPVNASGERTIYRGATTVSYELSGRQHRWMPAPVYKCRTGGTVSVDIAVNGNGYVITAEINKSKSNSEDPCLVEAAKRDAERSRFDASTLARQQGSITYIFQAQ